MQQPSELLKSFANRLAQQVSTHEGLQALRLLRLTNLIGNSASVAKSGSNDIGERRKSAAAPPVPSNRVGIWEKKVENGQTYFVRSKDKLEEWNYWANLGRIGPKGHKKRVVLIGESVARGYLYDPQYTCAMALEKVLQAHAGPDEIEVIDLARTNLGLEVRELAIDALQLEPDAVIIFSGNNWRCVFPPSAADIPQIDVALRARGMAATKQYVENMLQNEVSRIVQDIGDIYKERGVPLLWIIPEFNLGDWRDPLTNAPHLAAGANLEWMKLARDAQCAFQQEDFETAATLAARMVELDQGVNVTGLYILADCSELLGDTDSARHYSELARDAVIWDSSKSAAPRTYSVAQQVLREEAPRHGGQVLDMPRLFQEYLKGALPDRRIFLDYCHMTSEGIQVTMAAAAACVLKQLGIKDVAWTRLVHDAAVPSHEVEAEAAFLAAVHSAHWWQPYDVIHSFCVRAVQHSKHIAKVMTCFLDMQTRRTPMLMCRSAEQVSVSGSPLIQHYLLRYNNQQLDRMLLDAVLHALKDVGIDQQGQLDGLRKVEYSVAHRDIDLLDYYHSSAALQPQEVMWVLPKRDVFLPQERHHYYKAYWQESKFVFVGEADCSVRFKLTCRLHYPALSEPRITVRVNAVDIGSLEVDGEWAVWNITVPGKVLKDGLNDIVIEWPMPDFPGIQGYEEVLNDLMEGNKPEFFCIFGEIHTFVASNGQKAAVSSDEPQQVLSAIGAD
jgi:hypothetical protein